MHNPTDAELEILNLLWDIGEGTVQQVNEKLSKVRPVGYTTTLKLMQLMTQKGILDRRLNGRSHVYFPAVEENSTKDRMLNRFLKNTFGGSHSKLVMHLLGGQTVDQDELERIKDFLNSIDSKED